MNFAGREISVDLVGPVQKYERRAEHNAQQHRVCLSEAKREPPARH